MAPSKGTDRQTFRLPANEWAEFGKAASAMGTDRSTYLREFVRWTLRRPGAKMPKRPPIEGTRSIVVARSNGHTVDTDGRSPTDPGSAGADRVA